MPLDLPPEAAAGPAPAAIVAPAERASPQIHIDSHGYHFVVNGNRFLPESVVRATVEASAGPKEALDALNVQYRNAGHFLTAISAEVKDKLVAVNVIHGRLTEIAGPPGLAAFFSRLLEDPDIDRNSLLLSAARAEGYAAREGVRPTVSFEPGAEVGGTKMTLGEQTLPGAKPWNANLAFGNLGSRFSSRYTAGASGAVRPGGGVELSANYTQGLPGLSSDSSGSFYQTGGVGASWVTPWGTYGVSYSGISYRIGESTYPLYPTGKIDIVAVTGSQLVFANDTSRLSVTGSFNYVDNDVYVFPDDPEPFPLVKQNYGYLSAGLAYNANVSLLANPGTVAANVSLQQGVSGKKGSFGAADLTTADPHFGLVQASVNYNQVLPLGLQLGASVSGQYANSTVPQNQQWVVGGFGNLTAWLPAVLVGDSGGLARVNLQSPTFAWNGYTAGASAYVEGGIVRAHFVPFGDPTTRSLSDAGLAVTGGTPFGATATLAYAWPIASRNVDLDAINRNSRANLYFSLSQSF
jgi:hemolysin activation/secretion protein